MNNKYKLIQPDLIKNDNANLPINYSLHSSPPPSQLLKIIKKTITSQEVDDIKQNITDEKIILKPILRRQYTIIGGTMEKPIYNAPPNYKGDPFINTLCTRRGLNS